MQIEDLYSWYKNHTNRWRDSLKYACGIVGGLSTLLSVFGLTVRDIPEINLWWSIIIVIVAFAVIWFLAYIILGRIFKDAIRLTIRNTPVQISYGNIFAASDSWKVIACDSHFDTRVDDVVISKKSLHGQFVLEHGNICEIRTAVENEAKRKGISADENGQYEFPLGTIIPYHSSKDDQTYLMLAMTKLNDEYKACTNMAEYEQMLMRMWIEIDRVYASHDIALPLLGDGISRFTDGPKNKNGLLRCMLCTLNGSGASLNAKVNVVLYHKPGSENEIPLYEYRNMF